jgi:hypothetical protein
MWFQILGISYFYILDWLERTTFLANQGGFSGIIKKGPYIRFIHSFYNSKNQSKVAMFHKKYLLLLLDEKCVL